MQLTNEELETAAKMGVKIAITVTAGLALYGAAKSDPTAALALFTGGLIGLERLGAANRPVHNTAQQVKNKFDGSITDRFLHHANNVAAGASVALDTADKGVDSLFKP